MKASETIDKAAIGLAKALNDAAHFACSLDQPYTVARLVDLERRAISLGRSAFKATEILE